MIEVPIANARWMSFSSLLAIIIVLTLVTYYVSMKVFKPVKTIAAAMKDVAQGLDLGFVITIDYGDQAQRLYSASRTKGTVQSYYKHTPQNDIYSRIGEQDITAHVNFSTLIQVGSTYGLEPLALITQQDFLRNLGTDLFIRALERQGLHQREYNANLMAMRDLMKPNGLGGFRVLAQSGKNQETGLACLGMDKSFKEVLRKRLATVPLPLLTDRHLDLMAAKYPHMAQDWEDLWPPGGLRPL